MRSRIKVQTNNRDYSQTVNQRMRINESESHPDARVSRRTGEGSEKKKQAGKVK